MQNNIQNRFEGEEDSLAFLCTAHRQTWTSWSSTPLSKPRTACVSSTTLWTFEAERVDLRLLRFHCHLHSEAETEEDLDTLHSLQPQPTCAWKRTHEGWTKKIP